MRCQKFRRAEEIRGGVDDELRSVSPRQTFHAPHQHVVGWIGEVDFPGLRGECGPFRGFDVTHMMTGRFEFGGVGLHRRAVEHELLLVHRRGPVWVVAKEQ